MVFALTICASLLFLLIGLRFLVAPDGAAYTFGLAADARHEPHVLIGLRDLWLAALAFAFALLGEWRALALWFLFGSFVCFADSAVVVASSAKPWAIAFHVASGIFCLVLAWGSRRVATLTKAQPNGSN